MPVVSGLALGLGIAAAAGTAASTAIGYHAAGEAAHAQTQAAQNAIDNYKSEEGKALDATNKNLASTTADFNPYQQAGTTALTALGKDFTNGTFAPWDKTFQSPTGVDEQNDPGFQFRLQQGQQALERSAAAKGGLLSGGTAKAEDAYRQDYASKEYGDVYNRSFNNYQTNYSTFRNNQLDQYNRLMGVVGVGENATNALGNFRQGASTTDAGIRTNFASNVGNAYLQKGAAQASGYTSQANILGQGFQAIPDLIKGFAKPASA